MTLPETSQTIGQIPFGLSSIKVDEVHSFWRLKILLILPETSQNDEGDSFRSRDALREGNRALLPNSTLQYTN